ncbi:protein SODIUM POTASSIUM ROOT DEFECTIVE 2 [Manihot esculenta]|uniref:HMA domain-containing protein n=1 Tax=Manihot esculenta TaxID=3983 RepID=A0A2C9V986_MANES|nr:protein SODIUM POTASSIUM ROOT DEFECTIVE 2 [Manihot esculenta]OAY41246.1 hypothetical protein MANES_09G085600v8 [Manihot esculenta]
MKRIDIFCASQASTAICMSMDQPSSSSSSSLSSLPPTTPLGGRAIDRHNPIIRDQRRNPRSLSLAPCTSQQPPINPQPYHLLHNTKKNPAAAAATNKINNDQTKRKSSRKPNERKDKRNSAKAAGDNNGEMHSSASSSSAISVVKEDFVNKSWAKREDFITPPGSSRYLLSEKDFVDGLSDYDPVLALVPAEPHNNSKPQESESNSSKAHSTSNSERPSNQVVVLRVSLHCRGCEGKVRKHLSRMEGVRSYSIDFAAKKVTIVGDVTPLGVLASVSKVKSAQFWTSAPLSNNSLLNK